MHRPCKGLVICSCEKVLDNGIHFCLRVRPRLTKRVTSHRCGAWLPSAFTEEKVKRYCVWSSPLKHSLSLHTRALYSNSWINQTMCDLAEKFQNSPHNLVVEDSLITLVMKKNTENALEKHLDIYHKDISTFSFKCEKIFSKPLYRQCHEGESITHKKCDIRMNSKSEFHQPLCFRVVNTNEVNENRSSLRNVGSWCSWAAFLFNPIESET